MMKLAYVLLSLLVLTACAQQQTKEVEVPDNPDKVAKATFAGGCFWCMEPPFEKLDGVYEVYSGYSGGEVENPSYDQVSSGETEHVETVQVLYNPSKVSYEELLDVYWKQIDPTDEEGQFADRGMQYSPAIFYHNESQKEQAEKSKQELEKSGKFEESIKVDIRPFESFYKAEEYHQDYYEKHPINYKAYKRLSGRKGFIEEHWNTS